MNEEEAISDFNLFMRASLPQEKESFCRKLQEVLKAKITGLDSVWQDTDPTEITYVMQKKKAYMEVIDFLDQFTHPERKGNAERGEL